MQTPSPLSPWFSHHYDCLWLAKDAYWLWSYCTDIGYVSHSQTYHPDCRCKILGIKSSILRLSASNDEDWNQSTPSSRVHPQCKIASNRLYCSLEMKAERGDNHHSVSLSATKGHYTSCQKLQHLCLHTWQCRVSQSLLPYFAPIILYFWFYILSSDGWSLSKHPLVRYTPKLYTIPPKVHTPQSRMKLDRNEAGTHPNSFSLMIVSLHYDSARSIGM